MSNPFDAYNEMNSNTSSMSSIGHGYSPEVSILHYPDEASLHTASNYPNSIDIPKWAMKHEGYLANSAWSIGCSPKCVIVLYVPSTTLGVSFATLHAVGLDDKPLSMSDAMIKHIFSDKSFKSGLGDIYLGENGELKSAFGIPELSNMVKVVKIISAMYDIWRKFPNETDFDVVRELNAAMNRYKKMQSEVENKCIESQIEECRREMEVQRKRIEKLEKEMNRIYEEAADAANFLEEHGIDLDKKDEGDATEDQINKLMDSIKAAGWEAVSPIEWTDGKGMTLTMDDDAYHLDYDSKCDYIYDSNGDITTASRAS